jgi:hypothetical protein
MSGCKMAYLLFAKSYLYSLACINIPPGVATMLRQRSLCIFIQTFMQQKGLLPFHQL